MFPLKLKVPMIVFDIESTGVNPRRDRIIDLSAIKIMPDGTEIEKNWRVNPTVPIPAEASAVNHIYDEDVKGCPTFAYLAREIFAFFDGCTLCGFNSDRFDVPCLEEEFARSGLALNATERKQIDVMTIFHRMEPRNLTAAVKFYLNREHEGAHGASADARATLEVLKAQLDRYEQLPRTEVELDEYLVPHDPLNIDRMGTLRWINGELCINFGKKKGEPLKRLLIDEPKFLKWFANGDFDAEARRVVRDLLENGRLPPAPVVNNVEKRS